MSIPRPARDEAEFIVKHYPSSDRAHLFASAYIALLDETPTAQAHLLALDTIDRLQNERDRLLDENEALQRDKERLDWLETVPFDQRCKAIEKMYTKDVPVRLQTLREAIDAAREGK